MNSPRELLHKIGDPNLSNDQRVKLRCDLAKHLEQSWNFEAAGEAMGELWQCVGERPLLEGLSEHSKALVLLRAGVLTGRIGSTKQIDGVQEIARNLISESIVIFQAIGLPQLVSEAQIDLAYCYWREGALDEARAMLKQVLARADDLENETRVLGTLIGAGVERSAKRPHDALRWLNDGVAFSERINSDVLKGKVHNEIGLMLKNLGHGEQSRDYMDRALNEFAVATFYFERARLSRHQACAENNLGLVYGTIGLYPASHEHLDRAQALFTQLRDTLYLALTDDTRARVLLEEGRITEAEKLIKNAVRVLEESDQQSLLAEALTVHGIALARMHDYHQAHLTLERAADVAVQTGDLERAGLAIVTLVEQLGHHLSNTELCSIIERAGSFLEKTCDLASLRRLEKASRQALFWTNAHPGHPDWSTFKLKEIQLRNECHYVSLALEDSSGSVTKAAELLGLRGHQSLLFILNRRQRQLLKARTPVKPRRRSIIQGGKASDSRNK